MDAPRRDDTAQESIDFIGIPQNDDRKPNPGQFAR